MKVDRRVLSETLGVLPGVILFEFYGKGLVRSKELKNPSLVHTSKLKDQNVMKEDDIDQYQKWMTRKIQLKLHNGRNRLEILEQ